MPSFLWQPAGAKVDSCHISFGRHADQVPLLDTKPDDVHPFHHPRSAVAVKDNIATARWYPTTCGSKILQNYRSPFEATSIARLRNGTNKIGSKRVMGKTNMDEFGMGSHSTHSFFGPVRGVEGWETHSAGGSSGGSAVAVAAGEVQNALGTDTGGSVRLPAAYNGIVGFKPSYGHISRWGVVPYANSLDTVGLLGYNTSSIWPHLTSKLLSYDHRDPTSLSRGTMNRIKERQTKSASSIRESISEIESDPASLDPQQNLGHLKIGIPLEYNIEELEPAVRKAWERALGLFQSQGCTLIPVSLPNTKHALSAYYVIAAAEAASNLSKYDGVRYGTRAKGSDGAGNSLYSKSRGEGFGEEVKRRILLGSYSLSSQAIDNYFIKAQKVRRLVQRDFDRVFSMPNPLRPEAQFDLSEMDESVLLENKLGPAQVDFIVCPTAPTLPPTHASLATQSPIDSYMNDVFTVPSSLAGLPAISLPFGISNEDRVGIQIIGQYADDSRLLVTAKALEILRDNSSLPILRRKLEINRLIKAGWASVRQNPVPSELVASDGSSKIRLLVYQPPTRREQSKIAPRVKVKFKRRNND
jgi:aspartyl-tRNA(Asn)/glutamyl-tRNA(Gln) amidotransferase subunit A